MTTDARNRRRLLRWYDRHRRALPWRDDPRPYPVWVSEIMLQQTQVATVLPFFERFLDRFPDVHALAAADEEAVLAAWSGLGYYRRARQLHRAAREVVERFDGALPDDVEALCSLPGIGRYTAGAIASIAFGRRAPILDGNVRRVLSRLHGFDARGRTRSEEERELWRLAAIWAEGPRPGDVNQGLMELGATLCAPGAPACDACPLAADCTARRDGRTAELPRAVERRPTVAVRVAVGVVRRAGDVLLLRGGDGPLRGRWDLPAVESDGDGAAAVAALLRAHGVEVRVGDSGERVRHGILHRRLTLEVATGRLVRGRVAASGTLRWVGIGGLDDVAVSGATRKVLAAVGRVGVRVPAGRPNSPGQTA